MYSSRGGRYAPYKGAAREEDYEDYDNDGTKVFVGNLPWDIEWKDLKDVMSQGGEVVRADVMKNDDGRSKGWGIAQFATRKDAAAAIRMLANAELDGRPLEVRLDRGGGRGSGRGGGRGGGRGRGAGRGAGGRGRGRGGRGRGGRDSAPASKDDLDAGLDDYFGKESAPKAKGGKKGKEPAKSADALDSEMDDYFGKKEDAAPAADAAADDA